MQVQSALEQQQAIAKRLEGRQLALMLDYDGTLTPIVRRPEEAVLPEEVRALLRELPKYCTVAVVSGRDRQDVANMVAVDSLIYAGSHGFDIAGPGIEMQHEEARRVLPDLDRAEAALRAQLQPIEGAWVERKRFAVAIHYREVERGEDVARVEQAVNDVHRQHPALRKMGGKKIFELQPDVPWDKGYAVLWLASVLGLDHAGVVVIYIGDDVTDEHALRALRSQEWGLGIRVAGPESATDAAYYLRDCDEVRQFLEMLLGILRSRRM